MADRLHHRVLTVRDVLRKGDRVFEVNTNKFMSIRKEWVGEYYDPDWNIIIRPFMLPEDVEPKDVDPDEEQKKIFNFREYKEDCSVLIRTARGIVEVAFHRDNFSLSKDHIQIYSPPFKEGETKKWWVTTDELDGAAQEIL